MSVINNMTIAITESMRLRKDLQKHVQQGSARADLIEFGGLWCRFALHQRMQGRVLAAHGMYD